MLVFILPELQFPHRNWALYLPDSKKSAWQGAWCLADVQ